MLLLVMVSTGAPRPGLSGFSTRRLRPLRFQPHPGRHRRMYRIFVKMHLARANRARRAFSSVFQHLPCDRAGDRQPGDPKRALRVNDLSAMRPQTCENLTLRGIEAAQAGVDDGANDAPTARAQSSARRHEPITVFWVSG